MIKRERKKNSTNSLSGLIETLLPCKTDDNQGQGKEDQGIEEADVTVSEYTLREHPDNSKSKEADGTAQLDSRTTIQLLLAKLTSKQRS